MSFEGSACEAVGVCLMLGDSLSDELRGHVESCTRCRSAGELSRGLHGSLGTGPKWAKPDIVLEQYEVIDEIGRGGQGAVYKARDLETALIVALKVVALEPNAVEEVRLAANITHLNVCRINHTRSAGPFRVIVMEYVRGGSLRERMDRGPLETQEALRIFRGVCAGVRAAHERDVLHLDLKPGNILLRDGSVPVVCDFGLATTSGSTARGGTDGYMAPEQVAGGRLDQRTDVYALGVILNELVARPSRRVRAAIASACAESPGSRPATVAALLERLAGARRRFELALVIGLASAVVLAAAVTQPWATPKTVASSALPRTREVTRDVEPTPSIVPPAAEPPATPPTAATVEPSASAGGSPAVRAAPPTTRASSPAPPRGPVSADLELCCAALDTLSKKYQRPNVMNVASACPALLAGGYGGEIKSMVEKNLSCNGEPAPCEQTPIPAECR